MNPNIPGESGGQNAQGIATADKPVSPIDSAGPAPTIDNPVAKLEDVVAVARETASVGSPAVTDVKSPTNDFLKQFGDPVGPVQPLTAETPVAPQVADNLSPASPAVEATKTSEQTSNEKVLQQIKDILANYELKEKKPEEITV